MSRTDESARVVRENNQQLHDRLLTWELLISQLATGQDHSEARLGRIREILQSFSQVLERDLARGFGIEERGQYAAAAEALPAIRNLIWEFHEDHFALRERFGAIRASLSESGSLRHPERMYSDGMEFSRALRAHMRRDARLATALLELTQPMHSPETAIPEAATST